MNKTRSRFRSEEIQNLYFYVAPAHEFFAMRKIFTKH